MKWIAGRKIFWTLISVLTVTTAACELTNDKTKISAVSNSVVSNANRNAEQSPKDMSAPRLTSPSEAVKAQAVQINLQTGETAEAEIEVIVAEGFHINSDQANSAVLRPTELKVKSQTEISFGKPAYPKAEMRKFGFSDEPISVFQGTIKIRLPIQAKKSASVGLKIVRATIRAQPCSDNVCFPPRSVEFSLPVRITH